MTDPYAESDTWPNPPASQQPARPATLTASEHNVSALMESLERVAAEREAFKDERNAARAERDAFFGKALEFKRKRREERDRAESAEAEVERLEESGRNWHKSALTNAAACLRAERARDAALAEVTGLRDRLGRVEALRDRWLAVDVPSAEVTSWSHYAGAALRAALAVPVTGDTEDASPAAEDEGGYWIESKPPHGWSCDCDDDAAHQPQREWLHRNPASPTEQATEGGGAK